MKKLTAFRWCKGTNIVLMPQIYSANRQDSSIKTLQNGKNKDDETLEAMEFYDSPDEMEQSNPSNPRG